MIIDEILDRKDYEEEGYDIYNAHDFYLYCMGESTCFKGIADKITYAMDYLEEEDVQNAICDYIIEQGYNPNICEYVRSVKWLVNGRDRKERVNGGFVLAKSA